MSKAIEVVESLVDEWKKLLIIPPENPKNNTIENVKNLLRKVCRAGEIVGEPESREKLEQLALRLKSVLDDLGDDEDVNTDILPFSSDQTRVNLEALPEPGPFLFGREDLLDTLHTIWHTHSHRIVQLVGPGGNGKTHLLNHWLKQLKEKKWPGAANVFAWSFYSHYAREQSTVAEFLQEALSFFGEVTVADVQVMRDAFLTKLKEQPTIIILDGLEAWQQRISDNTVSDGLAPGAISQPDLRHILSELADPHNAFEGLCVITTRFDVKDFENNPTVATLNVKGLDPTFGSRLLESRGVSGTQEQRERISEMHDGHSLSLLLLGNQLAEQFDGDPLLWEQSQSGREIIKQYRSRQPDQQNSPSIHAYYIVESYLKRLVEPDKSLLRLLGFFRYPPSFEELEVLIRLEQPSELSEALRANGFYDNEANDFKWETLQTEVFAKLRQQQLLLSRIHGGEQSRQCYEAHPLVRQYFTEDLQTNAPALWIAGHKALYEHFAHRNEERPTEKEQLRELYLAVAHACQADMFQEAYIVYMHRIHRYDDKDRWYAWNEHNMYSIDLETLSWFYDRPTEEHQPWQTLAEGFRNRPQSEQSNIRFATAKCLYYQGFFNEAGEPMGEALQSLRAESRWVESADIAGNMTERRLVRGRLKGAFEYAQEAVGFANKSLNKDQQRSKYAKLGNVYHQLGQWEKCKSTFQQALDIHREDNSQLPHMYTMSSFLYNDCRLGRVELLLEGWASKEELYLDIDEPESEWIRREIETIRRECLESLQWGKENVVHLGPLDRSLNMLIAAKALGMLACYFEIANAEEAISEMENALESLQSTGHRNEFPRGFLMMARLLRQSGPAHLVAALDNIDKLIPIVLLGDMNLYRADAELERSWIYLELVKSRENSDFKFNQYKRYANQSFQTAKDIIGNEWEKGFRYGRRLPELRALQAKIKLLDSGAGGVGVELMV